MKKFLSFLFLLLITLSSSFAQQMIEEIEILEGLSPRPEASENEKSVLWFIENNFKKNGIEYTTADFNNAEGYYSFSKSIYVDIEGNIEDTIITVVPISSSYSIAAACSLIDYYFKNPPPLSLKFLFLGAEGKDNLGSRNFLDHYFPEVSSCFIYFNFENLPSSIKIIPGTNGRGSPYFLIKTINRNLENAGIPMFFSESESILMRMSSYDKNTKINNYLIEGYPAIQLNTAEIAQLNDPAMVSQKDFLSFYNNFLDSLKDGIPEGWDNHYIFGINEQQYLFILIISLIFLMIFATIRNKHLKWYLKTLKKSLLSPFLLFAVIFIFLSIATLILKLILNQSGFPDLWKYKSTEFFLFKIAISLTLYSLAFKVLRKLPFARKGSFYSISTIGFLVIQLIILLGINLIFSFFALWPLVIIFLFTIVKKPILKLFLLVASTIPMLFIAVSIFLLPSFSAINLLLLSQIDGNLLLSIIILPYIMATIRFGLYHPVKNKMTKWFLPILALTSIVLLLVIILVSPFDNLHPIPVKITQTMDCKNVSTNIITESPKKIDKQTTDTLLEESSFTKKNETCIDISSNAKTFLNREKIKIELDSNEKPDVVQFFLTSENSLTLYESSLPVKKDNEGQKLEIFIGRNPNLPLEISITINKDADFKLTALATFKEKTRLIEINNNNYKLEYIRKISKTINLNE